MIEYLVLFLVFSDSKIKEIRIMSSQSKPVDVIKHPRDMKLYERIRLIRKTLGITQGKFAKRIAISTGYLADMELGNKRINERILKLIVSEFDMNEHWLRTGEGDMRDEDEEIIIAKAGTLFKTLGPDYRNCALLMLEQLNELQNNDRKNGKTPVSG